MPILPPKPDAGNWMTGKPAPVKAAPTAAAPPAAAPDPNATKFYTALNAEESSLGGTEISNNMADLEKFGFDSADAKTASDWYLQEQQGLKSPGQILIDFYQTPIFAKYFPGIVAQRAAGNPNPMSPGDYVTLKGDIYSMTSAMGLPKGFITDDTIGKMVASNRNLSDIGTAIDQAKAAAATSNPATLALMKSNYGVDIDTNGGLGALAGFFLDPAHPLYGPNSAANTFNAANIGAEAQGLGFANIDKSQLLQVAQKGGTAANAMSGLEGAAPLTALENPNLAGNPLATVAGGTVGAEALGVATAAQQRDVIGASQTRSAQGSGGGGFSPTGRGTALGSASEGGAKGDAMGG